MLTLLVDHNMEGQAVWLWDTILKIELPDIIDMRMVMFADIGLDSLPVLTIGCLDRMKENYYRVRCAERIAEIVLDLKNYIGTGRIFIP